MNSSQVLKKTAPVLIFILIIIGAAVLVSSLRKDKAVPTIPNEESAYLLVNEGGRTYKITNKYVYDELKSSVGLTSLLDIVDRHLLSKQTKNYLEIVTDDEIDEAIEKAIFPNGKEKLTEEEIAKEIKEYNDSMYISNGLRTEAEIRDYHRLVIAKKLYASDQLTDQIKTADDNASKDSKLKPYFTNEDYETYYKANYLHGYWTILVPFKTKAEADLMLEQHGIKLHVKDGSSDFDRWVKEVDGEEVTLTAEEVAKIFISMYNSVYARYLNNYPVERNTLKEDVHYKVEDGKIVFNVEISEDNEDLNLLYYTNKRIVEFDKEIEDFVKKSMDSYKADEPLPSSRSWYTPKPREIKGASSYVYVLKIKEKSAPNLESVRDEIYNELFKKELTTTYINKEIIKLRESNKFTILDAQLEKQYIQTLKSYDFTHKATKESSKDVVAKLSDKDITAEDLFKVMDKNFAITLVSNEINYQRFLNNPELNKIYDYYSKDLSVNKRILDKKKWNEVRDSARLEKQYFIAGAYSQYGFPASYGWNNFMRDYHGVNNIEGLLYSLLYSKLRGEYAQGLGDISKAKEDDELWENIKNAMQKEVDEYFSVTAIQVLISVVDKDGNKLPQEKWTETQKQYAKELYNGIWKYIEGEPEEYKVKLGKLVTMYNEAPFFLAGKDQVTPTIASEGSQPLLKDNNYVIQDLVNSSYYIEASKFKSAGLSIEFNDLGTFNHHTEDDPHITDEIKKVAKEIWDNDPNKPSNDEVRYGYTFGDENYEYLVTDQGYHLYINTSTQAISKWKYEYDEDYTGEKIEGEFVLPTLQMIQTLLEDSSAKFLLDENGEETKIKFTTEMKSAISTHFTPIKTELTGSTNLLVNLYKQIKVLDIELMTTNYTKEIFDEYLDKVIKKYEENLTYFTVEE